jgi:puromycin-sensitive aminopeptidase
MLSCFHCFQIHVNFKATTVTFVFPEALPASSSITLTIDYTGILNNQMAGFYRSHYKDTKGVDKIVASTQFEALDARRAFPCVDEPAAKATFVLTLVVPPNLEVFSNMPESKRITLSSADLVQISFLESPKMSTYLLAFCIGEFDFVQAMTPKGGVLVKVYAPRGRSTSCTYALDTAVRALDAYDEFFGVKYPLPKLDMVAIPEFVSVRSFQYPNQHRTSLIIPACVFASLLFISRFVHSVLRFYCRPWALWRTGAWW